MTFACYARHGLDGCSSSLGVARGREADAAKGVVAARGDRRWDMGPGGNVDSCPGVDVPWAFGRDRFVLDS